MHRYMYNNGNKENPRIFANFLAGKVNPGTQNHTTVKEVKTLEQTLKSKMLKFQKQYQ